MEKKDGFGKMTEAEACYEGEWRAGMKHGKGAVKFLQKGDEYEGEWVSDRYCRCERARCCTRARGRECGHTCAGADRTPHAHARRRAHGKGVLRKRNGNVYEGEYKADKCDGFCVYRFTNGDKYEGEWKQGLKSGEGTISWHTGRSFQGRFADDCPIIGKLAEADGKVYRVTYDGSKKFSNGAQPESRELIPTESGGVEEGDSGDAGKPNPLTPSLMAAAAKLR